MAGKLEGRIVLVTGGSSGIGLATAHRFAKEGAFVFITGRRQAELDRAAAAIGEQTIAVRGDASNLADLDRLFEQIRKQKGRLDVLFVNAGGGSFAPLGSRQLFRKPFSGAELLAAVNSILRPGPTPLFISLSHHFTNSASF